MKTVVKGLLILGVAAVAYKYRSNILGELGHVLPAKGKLRQVADKASKTLSFVRSHKNDNEIYQPVNAKAKKTA